MKKLNNRTRQALFSITLVMFATFLYQNFLIVKNHSESLPIKWVVLQKGKLPTERNQTFVFKLKDNPQYKMKEVNFIKLVGGLPGDEIEVKGGDVYFDKKALPHCKSKMLTQDDIFHAANLTKIINPDEFEKRKINIVDKEIYVAGNLIGIAKPYSKKLYDALAVVVNSKERVTIDTKEFELHAIRAQKIPQHKFFAYTPHKDSYDSRYQEIGLIDEKDIIGVALFAF